MKKIIAALDGLKYSEGTAQCAVYIARQTGAHLVGVFLDDVTYHSYKIYDLVHEQGVTEGEISRAEWQDNVTRKEAAQHFAGACSAAGIPFSIHHDRNIALQELLHESIFADLLVIDAGETLTHYEESRPTRFIRELLANLECPVLLVPRRFHEPDSIVLLYDGQPSSVYAIKMFSYLFPGMEKLDTELVSVKPVYESLHLPDNHLMKEFMKRHFPDARHTVLHGLPDTEILNHLKEGSRQSDNEWIVLGAYERGALSRWLRPSMADILMQEVDRPLFIAHIK
ncbi:MAG TPA: universal stress protein [Puia sp.]|nr:universal stress protein [Puia sp.]